MKPNPSLFIAFYLLYSFSPNCLISSSFSAGTSCCSPQAVNNIRAVQKRVDRLHVVLLNACAVSFRVAILACQAAVDIFPAHVDFVIYMSCPVKSRAERFEHLIRFPSRPGTAVQYQYLHAHSSFIVMVTSPCPSRSLISCCDRSTCPSRVYAQELEA